MTDQASRALSTTKRVPSPMNGEIDFRKSMRAERPDAALAATGSRLSTTRRAVRRSRPRTTISIASLSPGTCLRCAFRGYPRGREGAAHRHSRSGQRDCRRTLFGWTPRRGLWRTGLRPGRGCGQRSPNGLVAVASRSDHLEGIEGDPRVPPRTPPRGRLPRPGAAARTNSGSGTFYSGSILARRSIA